MRITVLLLATLLISACNATEGESPHPDGSGGDGCETTRETLDQFCGAGGAGGADGSSRCPTLDDYRAEFRCIRYGDGLGVRVDRGCGYIRIFNNGDTGDGDIHVYDEKTAELVFMALRASSPVACGGQEMRELRTGRGRIVGALHDAFSLTQSVTHSVRVISLT